MGRLSIAFFFALVGLSRAQQNISLLAIGEWGDGTAQQSQVASAMSNYATTHGTQAVITCGDNIFPNGPTSSSDPKFNTYWKNVYNLPGLSNLPWLIALGDVDYSSGGEQYEINYQDPDWICPNNYHDYVTANGFLKFHVIVIDTVAIMNKTGDWDYMLYTWLPTTLDNSFAQFKLVVGYHPIFSAGEYGAVNTELYSNLLPILKTHRANSYMSAQENNLQYLYENDYPNLWHFISGGGGGQPKTAVNNTAVNELSTTYNVNANTFLPYPGFISWKENGSGGFSADIVYIASRGVTKTQHVVERNVVV